MLPFNSQFFGYMELLSREVWVERWSTGELQHKHDTRFLKYKLIILIPFCRWMVGLQHL